MGARPFSQGEALVVVDVQNDFVDPQGSLYVAGGEQVVPIINELVRGARDSGAFVVYTQDWHPPQTPHFKPEGPWPPHCIQGTWGAELHPELLVDGPVVRKGFGQDDGYSGFYVRDARSGEIRQTELQEKLAGAGVRRLIVVGVALDVCVKATALDGRRLGYEVDVVKAATRPVSQEISATLAELSQAGVNVT
jgi:nicotinamidase/pyrazinamidase